MSGGDPMDDLRRQFVVAARRQAARPGLRRRWRTRILAVVVAALATGAVAEAVNLVSVGEPVDPDPQGASHYGPAAGGGTIALTSRDAGRRLPWAVVTYRHGDRVCAAAGQLRGNELGVLRDGTFHQFRLRPANVCGRLGKRRFFFGTTRMDDRALVFGRARAGTRVMLARSGKAVYRAKTGSGGAFLFVFEGGQSFTGVRLEPQR